MRPSIGELIKANFWETPPPNSPPYDAQGLTWQLAQVEPNGYMGSNGYVGVSWGATDIYTRNGQLSGTGYDSRFVGWLRSHMGLPCVPALLVSRASSTG